MIAEFVQRWYVWIKAFHVIAVIAWMAGLLYLPRLFVYHAAAKPGSELSETLKVMERRLLRGIMNPAFVAVWVLGGLLLFLQDWRHEGWLHVKLACVALLSLLHHMFALWRKDFAADRNRRPPRFYRIANEIPTLLLIVIVVMVIVRPF